MNALKFFALTAVAGTCASALAGPLTYAGRRIPINVGVLTIESQRTGGEPTNLAPHVWGQLEKDRTVKPAAWSFTNPRANTLLTDTLRDRWIARGTAGVPGLNTRLSKDDAAYWEVDLDEASNVVLADYDALVLVVSGTVSLGPRDREKLRRFVDQGGLLWVDVTELGGAQFELANPLPVPMRRVNSAQGPLVLDPSNALLSFPNAVSVGEVGQLFQGTGVISVPTTAPNAATQGWVTVDGLKLDPIVGLTADEMTLSLGRIGDGYLMVSSRFMSGALNQGLRPNGTVDQVNNGFRTLPIAPTTAFRAAAKIVVNALSLRASTTTEFAGSRRSGSIGLDVPAPLMRRFETDRFVPQNGTSPILYKNRIIMVNQSGQVVVLDADPANDRDQNGNPDDGLVDPPGSPVDVLWQSNSLGSRLSTPTCTELVRASANDDGQDVILIHGATSGSPSTVFQFPLSNSGSGIAPSVTYTSEGNTEQNGVNSGVVPQRTAASPTVHEGFAFVTDIPATNNSLGRVWVIDLIRQQRMESGGRAWQVERAPRMAAVDGPATVGYIPIQDNSGGVDKVVYVPTQPDGQRSAGFVSIWFGSRGEAPSAVQRVGNTLTITTRASLQNLPIYVSGTGGNPSLDVKLSVINTATGQPYNDGQMGTMFSGNPVVNASQNGTINVTLGGFGQGLDFTSPNPEAAVRVDYTLDWGRAGAGPGAPASDNYIRGDAQLPDEAGNGRRVLGSIAMGPGGNLFVVTAPADTNRAGGSIFALRERGRGDFEMLYRWEAFDQFNYLTSGSAGLQRLPYDGAVIDYDGLTSQISFLNRPITNLRFATGPVVKGNRVYAGLVSGKALPFPGAATQRFTTTIMAFDAQPSSLEMVVEGLGTNFALLQPDPGRSIRPPTGPFEPNVLSVLQPVQFQAEESNGFTRVSLNTVASVTRGRFRDAIINNLPVIARRSASPDIIVQPDLGAADGTFVPGNADGRWNPQRWQIVINGLDISGNLFLSGNTLYFGGGSFLPGFLEPTPTFPPRKTGFLYAMDLRIGPNDLQEPQSRQTWMVGPLRPWERYLSLLDPDPSGPGVIPNPYVIWPSPFGIRSFDDFRVRVRQSTVGDVNASIPIQGLTGGNDALVAWDANQSYGFSRSDLVVVDESRVVRIDPSGFPLWSTDATIKGGVDGDVGSSQTVQRLSRPSRSYSLGGNNYLIVDPGNNRIVRVDAGGREVRTISEFNLDPIYLPPGVLPGIPKKLSGPRDAVQFTTIQSSADINTLVARNELSPAFLRNLPGTAEFWVHTMIADTGNQRVIELIDRFEFDENRRVVGRTISIDDPLSDAPITNVAGNPRRLIRAVGMLRWQIRSELTRKQYSYNSIDRQWVTDASGTRQVFAFGFGNVEPARTSFGLGDTPGRIDNQVGSGGVVIYDPATGASDVLTEFVTPAISNNVFWDDVSATFGGPNAKNPYAVGGTRKVSGLRSATLSYAGGTLSVMITDSNGVYELIPSGGAWQVRWMLPREAYLVMRRARVNPSVSASPLVPTTKNPMGFLPQFARRLNSGEVLLVNGYVGQHRVASLPHITATNISPGDPFGGEVVILDGSINSNPTSRGFDWNKPNLGFDSFYVNFELPPLSGTRALQGPVFAEKR